MGLYTGNTIDYYGGFEEFGAYQFITIKDIINNFRVAYVGEDKIISKISRADIRFHAMRGIQELTYDTFRSCKTLKLEIPPCLTFPLPHDYVNYVKLTWLDTDGIEHIIYPARHATTKTETKFLAKDRKVSSETNFRAEEEECATCDAECKELYGDDYYYDHTEKRCKKDDTHDDGEVYGCTDPNANNYNDKATVNQVSATDETNPCKYDDVLVEEDCDMEIGVPLSIPNVIGGGYGLDPQYTQSNGWFFINCKDGHIHFSSNIVGKTVVLEYISDGLGTDGEMIVHKMAEEAMYKHIAHAILNTRANTDRNVVATFKKERFAAIRNAKIRLSNIKLEEITQVLRGKSKWIKH